MSNFRVSIIQDSETFTLTNTAPPLDATASEIPTTTASPTGLPATTEPSSTSTDSQPVQPPVPAIFAAGTYVQNEMIVRFKSSTSPTRIDECFRGVGAQVQHEIVQLNTYIITDASGDIAYSFYHILDCAGVLYVEPNFLLQAADTIPNDPNWGLQYGLVNIRAPQGWDLSTGSASVTIAIVDSGVDYGHPDLAGKLTNGYDFVNNDDNPQDDNGHGTHVAGIAAASGNNATGVAGVSWGARIMPVKVLNASGGGSYANTADGVIWAVDHGAQVINLSLGGTGPSALLEDAVNYAHSRGAVIVAAAGNTGSNFVLYPARYPNAIAVARTNSANKWDGSSFGPEVDLSAPGSLIYSTVVGGYDYKSGSSMSTGFVSGLAAILMGIPGNGSPDLIKSQMESTALDIEFSGWDEYTGAGLVQMDAVIQRALPTTIPPDGSKDPFAGTGSRSNQVAPTRTTTPTWIATPILTTLEFTVTPTPEAGSTLFITETITGTLIEEKSDVAAQEATEFRNYVLPCAGILLILLGIILALSVKRRQQE